MKRKPPDSRNAHSALRLSLALGLATLIPLLLYGSGPSWWSERGVLTSNALPDDYAPLNQGQLKNIAKAAAAEMDAKLSGGAGNQLHDLIETWSSPNPEPNDFAPVNLGQLKNVAKPFYDRLIMTGLRDRYPWLGSLDPSDDFAVANIGQAKNLFAFDVPLGNVLDDSLGDRLAAGVANLALQGHAVWIWADGLSSADEFQRNYPHRVSGLSQVRSVSAGDRHLLALHTDGTISAWGENSSGQLGDGTDVPKNAPAKIPNITDVISAKAGGLHTLALRQDGTVLAWGDNSYGQLGKGDTVNASLPAPVPGLTDIRKIAVSELGSAALKQDGTVSTWGYRYYAPNIGHDLYDTVPTAVPDLTDVIDVAKGYAHTVAVKSDGTVWAWGANYSDQVGNGNPSWQIQETPCQVPNLSNVRKVISKVDHTLALTNDGTVWAWGYNNAGQLGDGTNERRLNPVRVSGLTDVIAIATGSFYSLAMKGDGTVWVWGGTAAGALPSENLFVPRQVTLGVLDANHNGIDDRWEAQYFGNFDQAGDADFDGDGVSNLQEFVHGTDPSDYFNGVTPVIEIASGNNQIGDSGAFLSKPLKVRVKNSAGQLLVNAPVTFQVVDDYGALASTAGGAQQPSLLARTDSSGEAIAYQVLRDVAGISTRTIASAGVTSLSASATFRSIIKFSPPPTPTPAPTPPDPNASPTPTPSPTATPIAPYRYAIIDLGKDMYPIRINNNAQILVQGPNPQGEWGNFRWKGGNLERLTYVGDCADIVARDINDAGAVVGSFTCNGPFANGTEQERNAGLLWPADRTTANKLSAADSVPSFDPRTSGVRLRLASLNAVNAQGDAFGQMCTGTVRGFLFGTIAVMNSAIWPYGSSAGSATGDAHATNDTLDLFTSYWTGSTDTIARVNSQGHYIGRKFVPLPTIRGFLDGTDTGMVDGYSVGFDPVDINNAGVVVGSAGADTVVRSSPTSQITIGGVSPLAINDHTHPAPPLDQLPSPTATPQPTPIPAPQVLSWMGSALVLWELQPDGRTWHPFGLEEMIPSMDGWEYLEPYDINDNGLIVGRAWYTDPSIRGAQGEFHAFLLVPTELMVDGNRDGEMSFDDQVVHDADQTSEEKPYRFWINNDSDGILEGDEVEGGSPDCADSFLKSLRDLEDFSRIWISFKGLIEMVKSGGVAVQLEWKPIDGGNNWPSDGGSPAINVFKAVEADGGHKYLSDEATAKSQVSYGNTPGEYSISLGRVGRGQPLTLPASFFDALSESQPHKFLLFEGAGAGKGQLVLTLRKDGQKVGEYPPLYLDLKDVRRMYERGKITADAPDIPDPWDNDNPQPLTWVWDPWNWPPDIDPNVEQKTIVYVHGWRMTYGEYLTWADTTFKRLWHLGYKGRFYSFRWPTYHGDNNGLDPVDIFIPGGRTYNPSEYRAWLSGAALANFVNGLPNANSRYLIAHSMGNVAAGSALRNNMQIKRYAMCNSAMAAMAYDQSLQPDDPSYETPDTDIDLGTRQTFGLAGKLNPAGTEIVNFSLPQDYALGVWSANNRFFKPQKVDLPSGKFYEYRSGAPAGSKLMLGEQGGDINYRDLRPITSVPEAMGYVTKSRTRAAGVRQDIGGSVISFVDMGAGTGGFQFGDEHSAEWVYPIRATYPFWKEILLKFDIDVTNR